MKEVKEMSEKELEVELEALKTKLKNKEATIEDCKRFQSIKDTLSSIVLIRDRMNY